MAEIPLILHIDDEPDLRDIVAQSLTEAGLRVLSAERLIDGIHLALNEKPNLILLDMHMPEGDGFETLIALRAVPELAEIPVIMVTGVRDLKHREMAKEQGAVGYITKPFSAEALLAAIKRRLA